MQERQFLREAKRLGVRVRFADEVNGGMSNASIEGADILVEKDNPNPVMFLMGHEWTHRLQALAPEAYRSFRDDLGALPEIQKAAQIKMKKFGYAYEEALDEAVSDRAGEMIYDGKVLDDFIERHRNDRTMLQKVRDAIRDLIRKLTGAEKRMAQTAEGKLTAAYEAAAAQAEKLTAQGEKENAATEGGEARYSSKAEVLALSGVDWMANDSTIKQQLQKHANEINGMEPVAVVEFINMTPKQVTELIEEQLGHIGGGLINRSGVSFQFDDGIDAIVTHASTSEEYAAALASPYVAKFGKLIAGHRNHKWKGNATLTYAAPVVINGETVNVGVVIMFTTDGRAHAVNVGLQTGGAFKIDMKKAPEGNRSRVYRYGKGTALPTSSASNDSKAQSGEAVKKKFSLKEIETEINSAGLLLTSKDNNKNNLRIRAWIKEHHPELVDRVRFVNDRSTGTVTVQEITEETEAARRQKEDAAEAARRKSDARDREGFGVVYGDDDLADTGLIRSFENRGGNTQSRRNSKKRDPNQ